jgi:hypothetical protein
MRHYSMEDYGSIWKRTDQLIQSRCDCRHATQSTQRKLNTSYLRKDPVTLRKRKAILLLARARHHALPRGIERFDYLVGQRAFFQIVQVRFDVLQR